MTHTYTVSGMTCSGCQAKVQGLLSKVEGVKSVAIDLPKKEVTINMGRHIPTSDLAAALKDYPKYQLQENNQYEAEIVAPGEESKSWLITYKPIILICAYLLGTTILLEVVTGTFIWMRWLEHFMAAFFLVFSFFKLLDLRGFADSYSTYDIIAKKWKGWGYVYPFIELFLGIAFLTGFQPLLTNLITLLVMTVSIFGVLQAVLNRRKIRCACLGSIFNLPMSTVTIVEDAMMIVMAIVMIGALT